jgi:hypothetical protein
MSIKVHVLAKVLRHDRLGTLKKGKVVELPDQLASEWLAKGWVERYETKVIRHDPLLDAGAASQSSASPVGQVSTKTTSTKSKGGARKVKTAQ